MLQGVCALASFYLDRLGVGGRHSFDEAWLNAGLYPACRIPRHVTVTEFLGYRIQSNPRASQGGPEGGHDLVERRWLSRIDAPRIDAALGEHSRVLVLSIAGKTAREIAAEMGWGKLSKPRAKPYVRRMQRCKRWHRLKSGWRLECCNGNWCGLARSPHLRRESAINWPLIRNNLRGTWGQR